MIIEGDSTAEFFLFFTLSLLMYLNFITTVKRRDALAFYVSARERNCSKILNCRKIAVKSKYKFAFFNVIVGVRQKNKNFITRRLFKTLNSGKIHKKYITSLFIYLNFASFNLLHYCLFV